MLKKKKSSLLRQKVKLESILSRPHIYLKDLRVHKNLNDYIYERKIGDKGIEQAEIEIKYAGYIAKEQKNADRLQKLEHVKIPINFNYEQLKSLSHEALEKLNAARPATLAQAARISGIKPSDISVILLAISKQ